jgi:hypothetical protein
MSLKTVGTGTAAGDSQATPDLAAPIAPEDTVLLELAMYTNYTWQGQSFVKGKAYKFHRSDAMQLLSEADAGRPVWKMFRAIKPKVQPANVVVDATAMNIRKTDPDDMRGVPEGDNTPKRIDVGSDDEISDILGREDGEGNETV